MLPLYDESATSLKPPYFTLALILVNVLIFGMIYLSGNFDDIIFKYGTIPNQILNGENLFTLLTSMFLHAGIFHLVGNMWFLWLFGDNLEWNLGPKRFIIFYLIVGIIASLCHIFAAPPEYSNIPAIGASGAISGLLGGYLVLFPHNRIRAFMMVWFRPYFFYVPAYLYIGIWFLYQLFYIGIPVSVAYMAHIGGFIGGIILILPLRRKIIRKDY